MYTILVKHINATRPDYRRLHVVVPRSAQTLSSAIHHTGALIPAGLPEPRPVAGTMALELQDNVLPIAIDPEGVVVHLDGSSVYVDVPYRCTYRELQANVIPLKLRSIGVHAHDVHGALADSQGRPVHAGHIWCGKIPKLWWTKLRVRVRHAYSPRTMRGIRALQRVVRLRRMLESYELV